MKIIALAIACVAELSLLSECHYSARFTDNRIAEITPKKKMSSSDDYGVYASDSSDDGEYYYHRGIRYHRGASDDDSSDEDEEIENSKAFEHCILNFCDGKYDASIQTALENFAKDETSNIPSGKQASPGDSDWDTVQDISRSYFKQRLKTIIEGEGFGAPSFVTNHVVDLDLTFMSYCKHPENEPMLWDTDSLESTWSEFEEALARHRNVEFPNVIIPKIELTRDTMEMLARTLKGRVQNSLVFDDNDIFNCGSLRYLSELINGNSSLGHLTIVNSTVYDYSEQGVEQLFNTVKAHPYLHYLSMSSCTIGDKSNVLSSILHSGMTQIVLNKNNIGSKGAGIIAQYVETNPSLECLELDKNKLNDADAIQLSRALRKNRNLKALFVRGNDFTVSGVKSFFTAIFDSSSMNAIYASNHSCDLSLFSAEDPLSTHIGSLNAGSEDSNRTRKANMALLHSTDSLLCYIADTKLELMPFVISLVQRKADGMKRIDMVHCIMRYWEMPSLYSCQCREPTSQKRKRRRTEIFAS